MTDGTDIEPKRARGRPRGRVGTAKMELANLCREKAINALEVLVDIMNDDTEKASARVHAANVILERGYGKAPQEIILAGDQERPLHSFSKIELVAVSPDVGRLLGNEASNDEASGRQFMDDEERDEDDEDSGY